VCVCVERGRGVVAKGKSQRPSLLYETLQVSFKNKIIAILACSPEPVLFILVLYMSVGRSGFSCYVTATTCVCVCMCVCVYSGTEASSLVVGAWEDFRRCLSGPGGGADSCGVGMQQVELSLHAFTSTYCNLRARHRSSTYSLVGRSYVASIGLFLRQLCFCVVCKVCEDISMDATKLAVGTCMCACYVSSNSTGLG